MSGEKFIYQVQVSERMFDSFGHLNNAAYLELLEDVRWAWLTAKGYGIEVIRQEQLGPVILEIDIKFKREIRTRVLVTVETVIKSYRDRIGTLEQRMLNEEGQEYAVATYTFGLFDMKRRALVRPTEKWAKTFGLPWPMET